MEGKLVKRSFGGQTASAIQAVPQRKRIARRPQYVFNLITRPYQIQPFMSVPVLPGETLQNGLMQSRVVTDPVINRLVGWWKEYYWFYVKHRDLANSAHFQAMMLDADYDLSSIYSAAKTYHYSHAGTVDWVGECLTAVVNEYFRDEGDNPSALDNLPVAKIMDQRWLDSVANEDDFDAPDDPEITIGGDGKVSASEIETAMRNWEFFRANGLTEMSYEDYLSSYGVRLPSVENDVPELLRYVRQWQYPISAIDPADGSAANAVVWSMSERMDKPRFFKEPGFVFGVTVARPKLYFGTQNAGAVGLLKNAYAWLPAILTNDPRAALQKITAGANGPLSTNTDNYWVDLRDVFLYGDQFLNYAVATAITDGAAIAMPTAALEKKYPTAAMVDALFADATNADKIREDGVMNLNILGHQVDAT